MTTEKRAQKIRERIEKITADETDVIASYRTQDDSVQAELRLSAGWKLRVPVDKINFPRDLSGENTELWRGMYALAHEITRISTLVERRVPDRYGSHTIPINARLKTGEERRAEAKNLWLIDTSKMFLSDYREKSKKSNLITVHKQISALQDRQKSLLRQLRECNSKFLAGKKSDREAQALKNIEALKTGRFWEADKDAMKSYFHPPFGKNYLADVSEKWRAALFLECESVSYKRFNGEWGHKLAGTERGYLSGIDDNGDEWGHHCTIPLTRDNFGDGKLEGTIEEAMSDLFGIATSKLGDCQRQGDLLFCPTKLRTEDGPEHCATCGEPPEKHPFETYEEPEDPRNKFRSCPWGGYYEPHIHKAPTLAPAEKWTPRESHDITSPSLQHNGTYFRAADEIRVTHTSHPTIILPPGEYRLYAVRIADAD